MALRTEPTSKSLERKLLIMGFEIPDLLAIFLLLSILNFSFGSTNYKLFLVWLPTLAAAVTLRIAKHGKPNNYLIHLTKFCFQPKHLSAFKPPAMTKQTPSIKRIQNDKI
jgi:hypothetical protein